MEKNCLTLIYNEMDETTSQNLISFLNLSQNTELHQFELKQLLTNKQSSSAI